MLAQVGPQANRPVGLPVQRLDILIQLDRGMILHGLLHQIRDEVFAQNLGEAGHVVDELVRVQGRDLAPEVGLAVDDLRPESPEASVV